MWVEERWRCIVRKILFVILISFLLIGCEKEPIKVGFIADISTKQSQLGVDARNSVELYLNKINLEGGIDGRMIDLIVKDDGSDSVKASEAHREFKDEGVYFVIGHLTSDMSDAVLNSQGEDLLFLSPSMSTDTLSENDDFFIRTSPINSRQGKIMSDYCHMNSIKDIVVIYDTSNEEYTKNLMDYFKEFYENDHFSLKAVIPFNSKEDDLENVANKVTQLDPSTVFMISQANDTAFITQTIKRTHDIQLLSVSWSMTHEIIEAGGSAVEGGLFIGIYVPKENSESYNKFYEEYSEIYNYPPSFISAITYDAMIVLEEGLKNANNPTPTSVKDAIVEREFHGLQETFRIDKYGDNDKRYLIYELKDGHFIPLREWEK